MPYAVYEVVTNDGHRPVRAWARSLGKIELAKLNQKIDMLLRYGAALPPQLLTGTNNPHIDKMRINCQRTLRLFLCRGPIKMDGTEFTLLHACIEKDRKLPAGCIETAAELRAAIINGHMRREVYERFQR